MGSFTMFTFKKGDVVDPDFGQFFHGIFDAIDVFDRRKTNGKI